MKLVVANHKMNLSQQEIEAYLFSLRGKVRKDLEVVICPCMIYLNCFQTNEVLLGSQNVGSISTGTLTGEVSAEQLKSLGVHYCLIGHSERRQKLNETNELIVDKIKQLFQNGITPILCIGETKEQRELHKTDLVLEKELRSCLNEFSKDEINGMVIAYEPIWSIGSGLTPSNQEIKRTISVIKEIIDRYYGTTCRILYGGSVSSRNIEELEKIENLDGYLVGGASLDASEWLNLLNNMK